MTVISLFSDILLICLFVALHVHVHSAFVHRSCRTSSYRFIPPFRDNVSLRLQQIQEVAVDPNDVLQENIRVQVTQLVSQRAEARWRGDYPKADSLRDKIEALPIPEYLHIVIKDNPRACGGGSTWKLIYNVPLIANNEPTVLNMAHNALGLAAFSSERAIAVSFAQLNLLVERAKKQLQCWTDVNKELKIVTSSSSDNFQVDIRKLQCLDAHMISNWSAVEFGLRGRKSADAAFWFALAGASDPELFSLLTSVSIKELERFGCRSSCRPKDVTSVANRLAAAGLRNAPALEEVVLRCLQSKQKNGTQNQRQESFIDLHSDSCALMIWKFSTRQRKQRTFLSTAAKHWEHHNDVHDRTDGLEMNNVKGKDKNKRWSELFTDPTRPLVVDLGCGMGVSLLGLASLDSSGCSHGSHQPNCNFIGVDLSSLAIGYATGLASRWGLDGRLAFVAMSADALLGQLKSYPGPIEQIMIQFPTPYRLASSAPNISTDEQKKIGGNSQLPESAFDGFMVTVELLRLASGILYSSAHKKKGKLIIQSNCEDVAVWVKNLAQEEADLEMVLQTNYVKRISGTPTKRTLNWIAMGGERAEGRGWSIEPLLPRKGRTETEIACILNGTPVHRCMLIPRAP